MVRLSQLALVVWLTVGTPGILWAQPTATPPVPAWQDNASVYLKSDPPAVAQTAAYTPDTDFNRGLPEDAVSPVRHDAAVTQAVATTVAEPPPAAPRDGRRLAPPTRGGLAPGHTRPDKSSQLLPSFGVPLDSIYTMLTALAMVVGLFLLCAWALRRGARSPSAVLPNEVVTVLGRVPLAARQFAQLLRVGNKLVLVSVTATGAETLAEVTDPAEVDRLLGICQQHDPRSTTREFESVFRQLAGQRTPDALVERDAPLPRTGHEAFRGGTSRG